MKNRIIFLLVLFLSGTILVSWRYKSDCKNCGIAVLSIKVWNAAAGKYVSKDYRNDIKIWYKDTFLIYHTRPTVSEATGNRSYVADVGKTLDTYTFQNGHSRLWEYADFSAAAPVKMSASFNGTTGWSVNNLAPIAFGEELFKLPMENLPDTVIDQVVYKRVKNEHIKLYNDPDADEYSFIGYLRCDKKDLPFRLNKKFDEKMGCTLTRIEYRINKVSLWFLIELDFVADQLSAEEVAIFDSWEKNAQQDPVYIAQMTGQQDHFIPPGPVPVRDSFTFCGVKYKIPRNCKDESQVNCCSAMTSPDQLSCYNGTGLFWHYMPTEESARFNFESLPSQWMKQAQKFSSETIDCYLASIPVKAYRCVAGKSNGNKSHSISVYGTVNGQAVVAELFSQKELKSNSDIQPVFQQIIRLKE
ncbi:MAG: hypothetical protein ABW019_05075 [Chitinophagaceae bacterium]